MCILKNYIKLKVGIICIILLVFIFCSASIVYSYIQESTITQDKNNDEIIRNSINKVEQTEDVKNIEYVLNNDFSDNWYIEIPQIGLLAPISEGTTQEVMSKYVGHFDNTNVWDGNIGLAAHNRRMSSKLFWKN